MGLISKTYTFSTGATILAAEHNTNFDTLYNWANGNVDNANVKSSAGINLSKLSLSDDATFTGDISLTNSATTDDVFTTTASSLTTGSAVKVYSNSSSTSTRNLVEIINDNASADACTTLQIQQDGDAAHINLTGDPANATPVDGDIWYDGSNFKGYNGSSTFNFGGTGQTLQVVQSDVNTLVDCTTRIPYDNSIPQITEGTELITQAITPTSATSKLKIEVVVTGSGTDADDFTVALFQDSTVNALAAVNVGLSGAYSQSIPLTYYMTSGTTSSTTFSVRAGGAAHDFEVNGDGSGNVMFGGVSMTNIIITEISA